VIFVVKIASLMHMAQEKRDKQPARLTVTLDERDHSEVCQLAEKNDVSAAWIIRRAVQYFNVTCLVRSIGAVKVMAPQPSLTASPVAALPIEPRPEAISGDCLFLKVESASV
jgi:hypothetical protein